MKGHSSGDENCLPYLPVLFHINVTGAHTKLIISKNYSKGFFE